VYVCARARVCASAHAGEPRARARARARARTQLAKQRARPVDRQDVAPELDAALADGAHELLERELAVVDTLERSGHYGGEH
jgi:hypothetical protein